MENGGNAKVNAIFEARLAQSGAQKPTTHADGHTRERFIRDKYERRKYYDESGYAFQPAAAQQDISLPGQAAPTGPPSDAARQRMEERRGRMNKTGSSTSVESVDSATGRPRNKGTKKSPSGSRPRKPVVAKAPASAPPPSMDLLDLMSEPSAPTHAPAPAHAQSFQDNKSDDMFDFLNSNTNHVDSMGSMDSGANANSAKPAAASRNASQDILSLYGNTGSAPQQQQQAFNTNSNNPLGNHMSSLMQQMALNQSGSNGTMNQQQQQPNMMNQQQQQPQNNMMNQQQRIYQQQQMMLMQQQQHQQQLQMMMHNPQQGMMNQQGNQGGMMNNNNNNNNNMMMMQQGMQGQQNNGGGFGAPMGSGPPVSTMQSTSKPKPPEKEDPFAQFGMNVFR
jgi:hypothetical protein